MSASSDRLDRLDRIREGVAANRASLAAIVEDLQAILWALAQDDPDGPVADVAVAFVAGTTAWQASEAIDG